MLCKEDGQSIQNHRGEESIDNNTSAELPQIDPTEEDDFFHDSGQETETSEVLSDYEFQVLDMDEEQTIDAMEIVTDDSSGGKSWFWTLLKFYKSGANQYDGFIVVVQKKTRTLAWK